MGARAWESTDVETLGDGAYRARIGPEWVLAMVPQGGLLAAIGARAMAAELETELPLRAIHGVFASPVPHGPVEAGVRVLRRGFVHRRRPEDPSPDVGRGVGGGGSVPSGRHRRSREQRQLRRVGDHGDLGSAAGHY